MSINEQARVEITDTMKKIPNLQWYYADKKEGGIYSDWGGKLHRLNPYVGIGGYLRVSVCHNGKQFCRTVHRLVLETFIGRRPEGMEACHNDGNRTNNCPENLRWDTKKNNHADKKKHGTEQTGERHGVHKLTEMQVRVARRYVEMYGRGSRAEIAKLFLVTAPSIEYAVLRKTWRHI